MKMIHVVIVDDEKGAASVVQSKIGSYFPNLSVVGVFYNSKEALQRIPSLQPHLIFVDIEMPGMNGFELVYELRKTITCEVIFVTAYNKYAVEAFRQHALGYILKPVDNEDFVKTVSIAMMRLATGELPAIEHFPLKVKEVLKIALPNRENVDLVEIKNILYVQAEGSYSRVVTNNQEYLLSKNLKYVESEMLQNKFLRVNRSFLVNPNSVKSINKQSTAHLVLENGEQVLISQRIKEQVFDELSEKINNL
jgi:two-component system LytT family response regulator